MSLTTGSNEDAKNIEDHHQRLLSDRRTDAGVLLNHMLSESKIQMNNHRHSPESGTDMSGDGPANGFSGAKTDGCLNKVPNATEISSDHKAGEVIAECRLVYDSVGAKQPAEPSEMPVFTSVMNGDGSNVNVNANTVDDMPALTDSDDSDLSDSDSEETGNVAETEDVMTDLIAAVCSQPEEAASSVVDTTTQELQNALEEGGKASVAEQYKTAALHYQKALLLLVKATDFEYSDDQRALLCFALGLCEINLDSLKTVLDGSKHFQQLVDEHATTFHHVLGYYGLARGFCRQNRYAEALQPVEQALTLMKTEPMITGCYWPGTETVISGLESYEQFEELLNDLLAHCRCSPLPDAVCRHAACDGHFKPQIYLSDLDFKGFVSVHCQERCQVEYHIDCWRRFKQKELDKRTDKEMLGTECVTPDCKGLVNRIRFYGPDGAINKEFPTDITDAELKPKKQSSKQKNIKSSQLSSRSSHKKEKSTDCDSA